MRLAPRLLAALIPLTLAASAHASLFHSDDKAQQAQAQQAEQAQTQAYVDTQMNGTLSSINQSLTTLLQIERGGEGPRRPEPLGPTVAGAAAPGPAPLTTAAIKPAGDPQAVQRPAEAPTPLPVSRLPTRLQPANPAVLDKEVDLHWNGSADALLGDLATQIGFQFQDDFLDGDSRGAHVLLRRRVHLGDHPSARASGGRDSGGAAHWTVRSVLEEVARQVNDIADVRVSLQDKTIHLEQKQK